MSHFQMIANHFFLDKFVCVLFVYILHSFGHEPLFIRCVFDTGYKKGAIETILNEVLSIRGTIVWPEPSWPKLPCKKKLEKETWNILMVAETQQKFIEKLKQETCSNLLENQEKNVESSSVNLFSHLVQW